MACAIEGCPRTPFTRGWCHKHYQRWWATGDPLGEGPRLYMPAWPLLRLVTGTGDEIARQCGVSRRTVQRWRNGGVVASPDSVAHRLGMHPSEIWKEWA